jgi:hypothetical protein
MRVELKRVKLTDRFVKSATGGGRKSFMDDEVIGFGVPARNLESIGRAKSHAT